MQAEGCQRGRARAMLPKTNFPNIGYAICHLSPSILNEQDKDGDTALHKAVRVGDLGIFNCPIRNRQVRLDVQNKEALTPLAIFHGA
jgi:hypothetical protein